VVVRGVQKPCARLSEGRRQASQVREGGSVVPRHTKSERRKKKDKKKEKMRRIKKKNKR